MAHDQGTAPMKGGGASGQSVRYSPGLSFIVLFITDKNLQINVNFPGGAQSRAAPASEVRTPVISPAAADADLDNESGARELEGIARLQRGR